MQPLKQYLGSDPSAQKNLLKYAATKDNLKKLVEDEKEQPSEKPTAAATPEDKDTIIN